jgi:hypothetical protein
MGFASLSLDCFVLVERCGMTSTALAPGGWYIFFIPAESFGKSRHFAFLRQLFGCLRIYVELTHAFDLFVFRCWNCCPEICFTWNMHIRLGAQN